MIRIFYSVSGTISDQKTWPNTIGYEVPATFTTKLLTGFMCYCQELVKGLR
jgi:hypothetical protein